MRIIVLLRQPARALASSALHRKVGVSNAPPDLLGGANLKLEDIDRSTVGPQVKTINAALLILAGQIQALDPAFYTAVSYDALTSPDGNLRDSVLGHLANFIGVSVLKFYCYYDDIYFILSYSALECHDVTCALHDVRPLRPIPSGTKHLYPLPTIGRMSCCMKKNILFSRRLRQQLLRFKGYFKVIFCASMS